MSVDREAQLGTDPVSSRYEHGLAITVERHFHQGAEAADAAQHFATHRASDVGLDSFDEFLAGVDIDTGLAIGYRGSLSHSDPFRRGGSAGCGILHQGTQGFRDYTMSKYFSVYLLRKFRPAAVFFFSFCALCLAAVWRALSRAELYQAKAPVADRSEAAQTAAFQAALTIVLVRVTGRRSVEDDPALAPLISNARRYVQQYRGAPDGQMWVSFDGPAIERWLTQNGQPLWGHERPTTFVWLTAQTGPQTGTIITADDTSELKTAIDAAAALRGGPVHRPR